MDKRLYRSAIRGAAGLAAVLGIGLTSAAATGGPSREATFAPPNDFHLQDNLLAPTGLNEAQFNDVINHIKGIYGPLIEGFEGNAKLVVNALWTNNTVNASASRSGDSWIVNMYGGLARRAEVTPEGFAVVMCHELGHHLGGYVFKRQDWASAEGQSDWYATQACARRIWQDDAAGNAPFRTSAPQALRTLCDAEWTTTEAQDLCYRVGSGGISAANLLAALGGTTVDISTPDTTVVTSTNSSGYPRQQCRLDTYITGALCTVQADLTIIPGIGTSLNNEASEREAIPTRCLPGSTNVPGYNGKDVPKCWFKAIVPAAQ